MSEMERRGVVEIPTVRAASDGESSTISGYAAVFNEETVIAGVFREKIAPGAFSAAVTSDDVRALFNHDPNYVLGRTTNGTLSLKEDKRGLFYDVELNPDDPDAVRVKAKIQRGDVSGSSFGFIVEEDSWDESEMKRGKLPLRTIRKASLFDVSPVTYPAYPQASVSARSMAESMATAAQTLADAQEATAGPEIRNRWRSRIDLEKAKAWQA